MDLYVMLKNPKNTIWCILNEYFLQLNNFS